MTAASCYVGSKGTDGGGGDFDFKKSFDGETTMGGGIREVDAEQSHKGLFEMLHFSWLHQRGCMCVRVIDEVFFPLKGMMLSGFILTFARPVESNAGFSFVFVRFCFSCSEYFTHRSASPPRACFHGAGGTNIF